MVGRKTQRKKAPSKPDFPPGQESLPKENHLLGEYARTEPRGFHSTIMLDLIFIFVSQCYE